MVGQRVILICCPSRIRKFHASLYMNSKTNGNYETYIIIYDEHGGGHDFIASKSLQFMAEHLVFDKLPIGNEVPDSSSAVAFQDKLAASWGQMKIR